MKVKWSGFGVVAGSGKLNGHVGAKNRAGAYLRTKVTPTNPQTLFQQQARARLTAQSQSWRTLDQEQRNAWDAATPDFAKSDIFGDKRNPTGKNLFTALNTNLLNIGKPTILQPPSPAGAGEVFATALDVDNAGTVDIDHAGSTAGHTVQVWATPPVSAGRSFLKNEFRLIATFAGGAASPFSAGTAYVSRFGLPSSGQKVALRLVSVNNTTGEAGVGSEVQSIA